MKHRIARSFSVVGVLAAVGLLSTGLLLRAEAPAAAPTVIAPGSAAFFEALNAGSPMVALSTSQGPGQMAGVILRFVIVRNGNPATNTDSGTAGSNTGSGAAGANTGSGAAGASTSDISNFPPSLLNSPALANMANDLSTACGAATAPVSCIPGNSGFILQDCANDLMCGNDAAALMTSICDGAAGEGLVTGACLDFGGLVNSFGQMETVQDVPDDCGYLCVTSVGFGSVFTPPAGCIGQFCTHEEMLGGLGGFLPSVCMSSCESRDGLPQLACPTGMVCDPSPQDPGDPFGFGVFDSDGEIAFPQDIQNVCDTDPSPCTQGLQETLNECTEISGGCDFNTYTEGLQGLCTEVGPGALPDGGCSLLNQPATTADQPDTIDELSNPPFTLRYGYQNENHAEFTRTNDGVFHLTDASDGGIVLDHDPLTLLFSRQGNPASLEIMDAGQRYTVVRSPGATRSGGLDQSFFVHHPDGFTYPTGRSFGVDVATANLIHDGDTEFESTTYGVRALPDGRYRVVERWGTGIHEDPFKIASLFSQLPEGTDTITLVEGETEHVIDRPDGVTGSTPDSTLSTVATGLFLDDSVRRSGPRSFEVADSTSIGSNSFLESLFGVTPGAEALVVNTSGGDFLVTKLYEDTTIDGRPASFIVTHPDGFNFTTSPNRDWDGTGPRDIEVGSGQSFIIRPTADGTYKVIHNTTGTAVAGNPDAVRTIFERTGSSHLIVLVEDGTETAITNPAPTTPAIVIINNVNGVTQTVPFTPGDDGKLVVALDTNQPMQMATAPSAILGPLFARFPGQTSLTIVQNGEEYIVRRAPDDMTINGQPVQHTIQVPSGLVIPAFPAVVTTPAPSTTTPAPTTPSTTTTNDSTSMVIPPVGGRERRILALPGGEFVLEVFNPAPLSPTTYNVTMETDEFGNRVFDLPGEVFIDPAPGFDVVNIADGTEAFALTLADIGSILQDAANGGKSEAEVLALLALGQDVSSGDGAFEINILNNGKPLAVQADAAVLAPTDPPEPPDGLLQVALRMFGGPNPYATLTTAMPFGAIPFVIIEASTPSTSQASQWMDLVAMAKLQLPEQLTTFMAAAYCLQIDKAVPGKNEIYTLADTATQRLFAPSRDIISAASRVEARGELNPDSDATAYFHAIRQWAVWADQEGYDQEGFAEAFLDRTEQNLAQAGQAWNDEIDGIVRSLIPNRYQDVQKVLVEAGIDAGR